MPLPFPYPRRHDATPAPAVSSDVLVGSLVLLVMLVGLAGIIVPVLPGLGLINAAVLVWALVEQSTVGWVALAVCLALWGAAFLLQYLVPGKRLVAAGIPTWVIAVAGVAGVVGFLSSPSSACPCSSWGRSTSCS